MKKKVFALSVMGCLLLIPPLCAQTWGKTKRLTWTSSQYDSSMPAIAVDGNGHIHVVYCADTLGHYEIYYKKSTKFTWSGAAIPLGTTKYFTEGIRMGERTGPRNG